MLYSFNLTGEFLVEQVFLIHISCDRPQIFPCYSFFYCCIFVICLFEIDSRSSQDLFFANFIFECLNIATFVTLTYHFLVFILIVYLVFGVSGAESFLILQNGKSKTSVGRNLDDVLDSAAPRNFSLSISRIYILPLCGHKLPLIFTINSTIHQT